MSSLEDCLADSIGDSFWGQFLTYFGDIFCGGGTVLKSFMGNFVDNFMDSLEDCLADSFGDSFGGQFFTFFYEILGGTVLKKFLSV
jgi:hypothetical protein